VSGGWHGGRTTNHALTVPPVVSTMKIVDGMPRILDTIVCLEAPCLTKLYTSTHAWPLRAMHMRQPHPIRKNSACRQDTQPDVEASAKRLLYLCSCHNARSTAVSISDDMISEEQVMCGASTGEHVAAGDERDRERSIFRPTSASERRRISMPTRSSAHSRHTD